MHVAVAIDAANLGVGVFLLIFLALWAWATRLWENWKIGYAMWGFAAIYAVALGALVFSGCRPNIDRALAWPSARP